METLYRKVEIKSERDLPKEDRRYYFHLKGNFDLTSCLIPSARYNQIKKRIDWYLQPVEPQEPKEDCIFKDGKSCTNANTGYILCMETCSEAQHPVNKSIEQKQTVEEMKHKINQIICRYHQDQNYKTPQATDALFDLIAKYAQNQQPEISVTDEAIETWAEETVNRYKSLDGSLTMALSDSEIKGYIKQSKITGAKWLRDKLKRTV